MEQFDITEFAKMFDAALASDNPGVQKALRNFMMVAAIVHAADDNSEERSMGPLETLVKKVCDLDRKVYEIQRNQEYVRQTKQDYYGSNPTWVYNPYSEISATTSKPTWNGESITEENILDLMKDLKFK